MTTLTRLLENPAAQRLALVLLHFLWQGLLVAIVAWLLLVASRRASANARYVLLVALFGLLAACPAVTFTLMPVSSHPRLPARLSEVIEKTTTNVPIVAVPTSPVASHTAADGVAAEPSIVEISQPDAVRGLERAPDWRSQTHKIWDDAREWLERHLAWVVAAWLLGVSLLSTRLLLGWFAIERLKRVGVRPVDGILLARLDDLAGRLRIARPVRLFESTLAEIPAVIGCLKPIILFPIQACTGLSSEQLEAILAHELAHIKRNDYIVNCVQVIVETVLFYHPVVWWLSRAIRREREACCDDVAVSLCGDRFVYVRALTAMEAVRGRVPKLAMGAGAHGSLLRRRILRLLGVAQEPAPTAARWLAAAATVSVAIAVGMGVPWPATAADSPQAGPLSRLSQDQISAYELKVAGAVEPAAASPSLVAILGDSRLKMLSYVRRLAFTSDGRSVVGVGNNEIAFWDPRTGEQQRVLRGHTERVDELAISRDGQTLVSGSFDHLVKVWDVASGKERLTLKGHSNFISAVAISPDGKLVASADSQIRLWDIAAGPQRIHMTLIGENERSVAALAISPDSRLLVSGGRDGKIHVWEMGSGHELKTLSVEPVRERWRALAFSPDGRALAAAGQDHGAVLWDTATWSIRYKISEEGPVGAEALAFTHDGRQLAVSMNFAARMIDVTTGKELRRFPKQSIGMNAIAVSPDDATVATTGHSIKLWDIATGQEKTPALKGHGGSVESVAFSPDGTTLATGSWDSTVKLWDVATRRERMTLEGHTASVQSVAFSPDGKRLASIGFTPELILWDIASGKRLRTWAGRQDLGQRVCFSPDGRWVAAETLGRTEGRDLGIWDVATGMQITQVGAGAGSYMFAPDGKKLIFAGQSVEAPRKRRLIVWDIERSKADRTTENGLLPTRLDTAASRPDGNMIALAGWDYVGDEKGKAMIVLWDLAADRPLYRLEQSAEHLAFTPDGRTLVGVGRDGKAQVWDPRNGTLRETIHVCEAGHFAIRDVAVAPDSRHFATAMGNGTARLFRLSPAPERVEPRDPLPVIAARPEPPIDLWKHLIGKPAPEFREVQGWSGGSAVKVADLRGKFVLLHFWSTQSAFQMGHLAALHEKFADLGLVIIAVQPDWGFRTVKEWQARANRQREWGDRPLPFRIALDGGGKTPIEDTGAMAPGATFAAFGVQNGRGGQALQPVNLLIGPDGRVVMGRDSPWSLEREIEGRMGVKAKVPAWRARFERRYALADGQVLKRVGPPYPPERADFLLHESRGWQNDTQHSEVFRWDGQLRSWGQIAVCRLADVLGFIVLDLRRGELDGPADVLKMPVPGDWIVRPGASKADELKALERILADELKTPVHFTQREVEREVIVAKGRYQFHALGDLPDERAVYLTTEALASKQNGGGGSGSLREMLDWLSDRVNRLIIDDTGPPNEHVQWRDHLVDQAEELGADTESGRAQRKRLLENVSKQTSLTFHQERRKVKVWFISRD